MIHGTSTSLGSRFRGGPDAKDLSDIFVYHVACDSTIGDVKSHLKQQEIPVQQIRIDITSNKDSMYKSFRVIAPGTYKDMLMSPEVWPVGVKVREYESQGWPVAFTGGICHRYLPVNTGVDNTPKSGVYRHLLAFINILLISLQITLLTVLATYYIIHGHHSTIFAAYA